MQGNALPTERIKEGCPYFWTHGVRESHDTASFCCLCHSCTTGYVSCNVPAILPVLHGKQGSIRCNIKKYLRGEVMEDWFSIHIEQHNARFVLFCTGRPTGPAWSLQGTSTFKGSMSESIDPCNAYCNPICRCIAHKGSLIDVRHNTCKRTYTNALSIFKKNTLRHIQ